MKQIISFKDIKIKYLFLMAIILINIVSLAFYSTERYITGKNLIIKDLDAKLLTAAYGAKFYTDPYHDQITDENSFEREDYLTRMDQLTHYGQKIDIEFVYTVIVNNGKIVFTSENPPLPEKKELRKTYKTKFFVEYKDASNGLLKAIKDKKVYYDEYDDRWGYHRSIFLPTKSPGGMEYIIGVDISMRDVQSMLDNLLLRTILIGLGVFTISSIFIIFMVILLVKPLKALTQAAEVIGNGNLDAEIPDARLGYEISKLTETIQIMQRALKSYIDMLKQTITDSERIESELRIANNIQMDILPKSFPARAEFDVYVFIKPAREVGGDFYDIFFVDDDTIGFVIADVSDKGVPAALFMAVAKTLIKAKSIKRVQPGEILAEVNDELCKNNESSMFVTAFFGMLNIKTGELIFSNAGHNPPLIMKSDNTAEFLQLNPNFVLGGMEDFQYKTESLKLQKGDIIFMYTDGVTEAMNEQGDFYSDKKLKDELKGLTNESCQQIIETTSKKIEAFAGNAEQTDDIAIMAVKFIGN